ncbi:hypothetical protein BD779DRAFT_1432160 [Infundibulicybe gibba]|nr:hypothetical protein BD779DRAFT_1432160 [Infundibulicybe gibba]
MADYNDDWSAVLKDHPIFSLPKSFSGPTAEAGSSLELSTNTLNRFTNVDPAEDGLAPSGRRQVMVLKDADLILAAGREIRISSLGDTKLSQSTRKSYKTLHTPNIQFEIHQIALNPSGKLLAVAGAFQVAVLVLPRAGFTRLVPDTVDCRSVQVGQFYHASHSAAPIVKIEWHPWGEAGSTLMVMTMDGKLREYDISVDTEEPQQVLSFVPEKKTKSFIAEDASEREVASFSLGKGHADWGPLTVYAVMKSGDVYAICPYLPRNTSIPSSYVHSLECFISAKQEFLSQATSSANLNLSTLYDHQKKYVNALIKQLPPGTLFPAASRSVPVHPPTTIRAVPKRQGPFLLQPAPRILEGSEGGDATDITYLAFGADEDEGDGSGGETEHLGVIMVAFQDGKVDVCLDVEKVEARWENKQVRPRYGATSADLPMLAIYETIDLGLIASLNRVSNMKDEPPILDLLQGNHPAFLADPIHDDTLYVYHAFGVHALNVGPVLRSLALALRADDDSASTLEAALHKSEGTEVHPILSTFSVERKCSNPVIAISIPNDVYLTYSIFALTSAMRVSSFPLTLRSDSSLATRPSPESKTAHLPQMEADPLATWLTPPEGPAGYVSFLANEPYTVPPILSRPTGLPTNPRLSLPASGPGGGKQEFMLTPDTLRYIGSTVAHISAQIHDILFAYRGVQTRAMLQRQELLRQSSRCKALDELIAKLKAAARTNNEERFRRIQDTQKVLLARLDRMLQGLMEKASPELSEHETKWFEELKRMKQEIMGAGKYDEGSLAARIRLLEREYARLLPNMKALLEKEKKRKAKAAQNNQALGFSQAFEFGERSNLERTKIVDVEREISRLAKKLDISLARPPDID